MAHKELIFLLAEITSSVGLGSTKINLTIQIRLWFKNFDDLGIRFSLGLRLLNYKGYGSV